MQRQQPTMHPRLLAPGLLLAISLFALASCDGKGAGSHSPVAQTPAEANASAPKFAPLNDPDLQLLVTPSPTGHQPFIEAIDQAKTSVRLVMYHLTDAQVIEALINARRRNVAVQVILDQTSLVAQSAELASYNRLQQAGVEALQGSTGFSITHEKSMAIDGQKVFITAMNMTTGYPTERDFGIVTSNPEVIAEWNAVFSADVENSKQTIRPCAENKNPPPGPAKTPELSVPSLIWSPVSSVVKLPALIDSATSSIIATVENITDTPISNALAAAARRGVKVQLMTPQCVVGDKRLLDYPTLQKLKSPSFSIRIMQNKRTPTNPYLHSKMILVDDRVAYVGSINFTDNSIAKARETGIIFVNSQATQTIGAAFSADWSNAIDLPDAVPAGYCQ